MRRCRALTRDANALEREIALGVADYAPQLLQLKGCGALIAARSSVRPAALHGFATTPSSRGSRVSPRSTRHPASSAARLNRHGNRQLNSALHKIAIVQAAAIHALAPTCSANKRRGKTRLEALRALKRHLARTVFGLLRQRPRSRPR